MRRGKTAASGEIEFDPNHHHQSVGPMAGVISASMPVYIVHNRTYDNYSYTNVNEGLGKCLRFGAYDESVIKRLRWIENTLYPIIKEAIELSGGIDLKSLVIQALQSGDDCHNRNRATTALLSKQLSPYIALTKASKEEIYEALKFIDGNEHFAINTTMAMCKAIADAAHGIENSTIVTAMCRNGTDFGIRISGLGDKWFTAPANTPVGLFFSGFTQEDANPDIGDSTITETVGIGGFAMAAAPAIVKFVGGTPKDAINFTLEMRITATENQNFRVPSLDFKGTPTGIELIRVLELESFKDQQGWPIRTRIGQIGAGLYRHLCNVL